MAPVILFRNEGSDADIAWREERRSRPKKILNEGSTCSRSWGNQETGGRRNIWEEGCAGHFQMKHVDDSIEMVVIADPGTLGEFRDVMHNKVGGSVVPALTKDLADDSTGEIVQHVGRPTVKGGAPAAFSMIWNALLSVTHRAAKGVAVLYGILSLTVLPLDAQTVMPASPSISQNETSVSKSVEVEPAAGDAAIANRIQRILQSTGWFKETRVIVRDGVVFIDGKTESQDRSRWAGALAQNTQGAVAVVNRIGVDADVGSTFGLAGDEFLKSYRQALLIWPWIIVAVVILMITWLVSRLVEYLARRFFHRRIGSPLLLNVIVRMVSIPVFLLGFYFVLQVAGLTRLALTILGGTGLFGIVVGFAFRDIAENFLSSVLLSVRNPFDTGDLIEVDGNSGIVQNLNVRTTILLTLDGNYVQIPNAIVFKNTITNFSRAPNRRADFSVGISYDSSIAVAQALIVNVLKQHPAVLDVPEPLVLVEELGQATVNIRAYYWFVSATYSPIKINSALLRLTKEALLDGGIELPDAAREVIFPKGIPLGEKDGLQSGAIIGQGKADRVGADAGWHTATVGEGGLSNEAPEVAAQSQGNAPEADQNLLKDR